MEFITIREGTLGWGRKSPLCNDNESINKPLSEKEKGPFSDDINRL